MATKTTTPEKETKEAAASKTEKAAKSENKPGRKAGTIVNENDLFIVSDDFDADKKIAPQAKAIANIVKAAGTTGITRAALLEAMESVVTTRQPQARILSYYQKTLVDNGFFNVVKAEPKVAAEPTTEPDATTEGPTSDTVAEKKSKKK